MGRFEDGYKLMYTGEETDDALTLARNVKFVPLDDEWEEYASAMARCAASYLVHMAPGTTTCIAEAPPDPENQFVAIYLDNYNVLYMDLMKYEAIINGNTTFCHFDTNDLTPEEQALTPEWHPSYNGRYDSITIDGRAYPILYMNCSGFVTLQIKNRDYISSPYYLRYTKSNATVMELASRCVENGDTATSPWTFDCMNLLLTWRMAECMRSSGCTPFLVGKVNSQSEASFEDLGLGKLRDGDLIFCGNKEVEEGKFAERYLGVHHCLMYFKDLSRLNDAAQEYRLGCRFKAIDGDGGDVSKGYVVHCSGSTDGVIRGTKDVLRIETLDSYLKNCDPHEKLYGCRVASNALNSSKMHQNITSDLLMYDCIVTNPWRHNATLDRIPTTTVRAFVEDMTGGTYSYTQYRYNQPKALVGAGETLDFDEYIGARKAGIYCLWTQRIVLENGPTSSSNTIGTDYMTSPTNVYFLFEVNCITKDTGYTVQTITTLESENVQTPHKWERSSNGLGTLFSKWRQIY